MRTIRPVDGLDALAYIRAQLTGDLDAIAVLLSNGDPARMLIVAVSILNALALRTFGNDQAAVLRFLDAKLLLDLDLVSE
jgi:hypothetical protein